MTSSWERNDDDDDKKQEGSMKHRPAKANGAMMPYWCRQYYRLGTSARMMA